MAVAARSGVAAYQRGRAATIARAGRGRTAGRAAETYITAKAVTPSIPRVRPRKPVEAQKPVMTAMVVTLGAGFLHAWLVEKKNTPERSFFVRMAILGFVLALLAEVTPRVGKGFAYLIMTAVIFDRSQDILAELQKEAPRISPERVPRMPPFTTPDTVPVTLYVRNGPMTTEMPIPLRRSPLRPQNPQPLFQYRTA